ncbi:chlorohydrolase [Streptococcus sp. VT 162]|nr:chlorohydrolase [Streptococcus sp. VT 162]
MKIKEQTRKIAVDSSKHCFEVVDRTDEVSTHTYGKVKLTWFEEGKVKLTWFEEIFEVY